MAQKLKLLKTEIKMWCREEGRRYDLKLNSLLDALEAFDLRGGEWLKGRCGAKGSCELKWQLAYSWKK